ncbi:hypothetical protein D3C71_197380 [compost metagenome]
MRTTSISKVMAALALATLSPPLATAAESDTNAIDTARRAISMGYGTECSLDMKPVDRGGYYPCIDIAPYRIVFLYGSVRVFVAQKDRSPFPVMEGPQESPVFTVDGPWTADLSARVALWWRDTVEGGAHKAQEMQQQSESKKAAEEYVNKLMGKEEPKAAPATPPAAQPTATADTGSLEVGDDIRQILQH